MQANTNVRRARAIARTVILLAGLGCLAFWMLPIPQELLDAPAPNLEFVDRRGQTLRELLANDTHFARRVPFEKIPRSLIDATVAAEDHRFWQHNGVDLFATARALRDLVWHQRVMSGASTITQQLVKLAQRRSRNLFSKITEAVTSLRIEQSWSKQRILEEYLNRLDYGNMRTGCASAARYYFSKPLSDLSVAESAFLAGLPQAPGRLNPHSQFAQAKARQEWVLLQMFRKNLIDKPTYHRASAERLRLASAPRIFQAPHFVDLLLSKEKTSRGITRTTLDLDLTRAAEEILKRRLRALRGREVTNGAIVIIENQSSDVLALVGSEDYFAPGSGQVNGAWALRSAGSTLKPFTYLLAFERGGTPATIIADVPTEFTTPSGLYRPVNYDQRCYGPTRYRIALANSLNISATKVLASIGGPATLQRLLRECGITTLQKPASHYGLGLTIGNAEVRLLELTNAYACLARLGEYRPYRLLTNQETFPVQVASPAAAWLIADILSDNSARTPAFGMRSPLRFDFPVACKTGTSSDFRDNWAIGYTPEFTVGVWVGNFDNSPMQKVSGVTGAAPILRDVFTLLHERFGTSWFARPANIIEARVHKFTGKLVSRSGEEMVDEKFVVNKLPQWESPEDYEGNSVRLPSEYQAWAASPDNFLGKKIAVSAATHLQIVSPLPGTTFLIDDNLPENSRWIPLKSRGSSAEFWRCDSLHLREEDGQMFAHMREGRHVLTVSDNASTKATWIVIKRM
jgi:penicillin-binding protein 1C